MNQVLVVAPHPDDETLGCGGTLLKHKNYYHDEIHWLIVTGVSKKYGFSSAQIRRSKEEIKIVAGMYGFSSVNHLNFPTMHLDEIAMVDIIDAIARIFHRIQPNVVYLPYSGDIHTDHKIVFNAASSCTKSFRYPSVRKVIVYETLSETNFSLEPKSSGFCPNLFINISKYLHQKIVISEVFVNEFREFPFPRSKEAMQALAAYRGTSAGCNAAEAFMILKEIA